MEERIAKLEKSNRTIKTLLIIVLLIMVAVIAAAVGGALYVKNLIQPVLDEISKVNFSEVIGVMNKLSAIDFDKINEALRTADKVNDLDWAGLESAIENFKETGAMLGEFNEKMNAISGFFGK